MAWYHRLANVFRHNRLRHEVEEELAFHIQEGVDELRDAGHNTADAERQAHRQFGNLPLKVEETIDMNLWRWLEELWRDLRIGLRGLLRRPGFLMVVLLTLAVGVGGASAIAGAIHGILLKPLPYPQPDRLVAVWQHDLDAGEDRQEVSPANFLDWRERVTTFEHLVAMEPYGLNWQSPEGPIYLSTQLVSEGFFDAFGAQPLLGRTFILDEHDRGRGDVVVLGYMLWRTRFGGAPDVVGRVLTLDDRPHTVVGIMSEGFAVPSDDVVWAPKVLQGWEEEARTSNFYLVFGRLRPDASISEAAAELDTVATQLAREYPRTNASTRIALVPLVDQMVGRIRGALWLLFGAVGLVLAVVTAAIASLQLARAVTRRREFAVRSALGAGVGRVTRQLVAENAIVAVGRRRGQLRRRLSGIGGNSGARAPDGATPDRAARGRGGTAGGHLPECARGGGDRCAARPGCRAIATAVGAEQRWTSGRRGQLAEPRSADRHQHAPQHGAEGRTPSGSSAPTGAWLPASGGRSLQRTHGR